MKDISINRHPSAAYKEATGKGTHGGSGRGQGRHSLPEDQKKIMWGGRFPPDMLRWLYAEQERTGQSIAVLIEGAVRARMVEDAR